MSPRQTKLLVFLLNFVFGAVTNLIADSYWKAGFVFPASFPIEKGNTLLESIKVKTGVPCERILINKDLSSISKLKYKIIFSGQKVLTGKEVSAFYRYVNRGGILVGVGEFGTWLDFNMDGKIEAGIDHLNPKEITSLTGCKVRAGNVSIIKIQNLCENPILRNFYVNKWIDYPVYRSSASVLEICGEAFPLAEARFSAFGWKKKGFKYHYLDTRLSTRYESYITVRLLGKGIIIRLSENIFLFPVENIFFKTLWKNLVNLKAYACLKKNSSDLKDISILYEYKNFIPNPDFEEICYVDQSQPCVNNAATPPFLMPAGWQFNSWNGKYFGMAKKMKTSFGEYVITTYSKDPESRQGGSTWEMKNHQTLLKAGGKYTISLMAKGQKVKKANFILLFKSIKGKKFRYENILPSGTFDWQKFSKSFSIPLDCVGENAPARGFDVQIFFKGPGQLFIDHVILKKN